MEGRDLLKSAQCPLSPAPPSRDGGGFRRESGQEINVWHQQQALLAAAHRCVKTQSSDEPVTVTAATNAASLTSPDFLVCLTIYSTQRLLQSRPSLDALQKRRGRPPNWLVFGTLEGAGPEGAGPEERARKTGTEKKLICESRAAEVTSGRDCSCFHQFS